MTGTTNIALKFPNTRYIEISTSAYQDDNDDDQLEVVRAQLPDRPWMHIANSLVLFCQAPFGQSLAVFQNLDSVDSSSKSTVTHGYLMSCSEKLCLPTQPKC